MKFLYKLGQAILILLDIVLIILTIAGFSVSVVMGIIFLIITIAVMGLILVLENKYKNINAPKKDTSNAPVSTSIPKRVDSGLINNNITPVEPVKPKPIQNSVVVPQTKSAQVITKPAVNKPPNVVNSKYLRYYYSKVKIATEKSLNLDTSLIGKWVELVQEPTNQYDENAIMVSYNDTKLGYLFKGTLQDMANRWLSSSDGKELLSKVEDIENNIVYVYLAFYEPISENMVENTFKFTISAKNYDEWYPYEGQELYFNYDFEKEKYSVDELGYAPKSATSFIESIQNEKGYISYISKLDEKDNGSYFATVETIYIKSLDK